MRTPLSLNIHQPPPPYGDAEERAVRLTRIQQNIYVQKYMTSLQGLFQMTAPLALSCFAANSLA
ncbi:MAG: hypothetical protein EBT98_02090 [Opitutaceae bacterium]|nr:hypothetical protein [Opitutaceae bacterium]